MSLVEIIRKDIFDFLEQNQELLFNERDFQIHLASWLRASNNNYDDVDLGQMSLFDTVKDEDIINELKEIDISNLTPLDALNTLYRLQNKLKNRW